MIPKKLVELFRVTPGKRARIDRRDPSWAGTKEMRQLSEDTLRGRAGEFLRKTREELAAAQNLLYADDRYSLLLIFQAMDAAGKDGTIRHVMSGVNPQGCQVVSFKQPSAEELDHTFLWRSMKALPEKGRIGIFNRSYYEEVLVVKVHPEWLQRQKLPPGKRGRKFWEERYDDINRFERHLVRNGTVIRKFFLNVSKKEQKKRFLERLTDPEKHWKFSAADIAERGFWDDYQRAYEEAITATSTEWAPWHVIPADRKWVTRALVAGIVTRTLLSLGLRYPEVGPEDRRALAAAKRRLLRE